MTLQDIFDEMDKIVADLQDSIDEFEAQLDDYRNACEELRENAEIWQQENNG
jgi:SMC interacting uncharacterized protein involved in chromosome segregation